MKPAPNIAVLLQRVGSRDSSALQELHEASANALFGIILSVLKDRHESEEVLQDVFLRIWKNATSYRSDRGSAMSWLITIARNTSLDRYRQRNRKAINHKKATPDLKETLTMPPASASDLILTAERRGDIQSALQALSLDQREAIELAFFSGHTQTEVADKLGVPLGTVKARIRRGMQSLKPLLTQSA